MTNREPPAPPRIKDVERYWQEPPPEQSERCLWWVERFASGWRLNRRVGSMGYHERAEYYGVYVWELLNVLSPIEARNTAP